MRIGCASLPMVLLCASVTWAQELDPTLQQVIDTRGAARVAGDADEWGRHVTDDYILIGPAFFRYKSIVGNGLRARSPCGRATEAVARVHHPESHDRARSAGVVRRWSVSCLWVGTAAGQFRVMHQRPYSDSTTSITPRMGAGGAPCVPCRRSRYSFVSRWPRREESIYWLLFPDWSTKVRTATEMDGLRHAA